MRAPTHRRKAKHEVTLTFEALSIEGGMLSPEWLAKAAQLEAGQQSEADYRIPKGLNLRDEIGRYWRIAEAYWRELANGRASGGDAGVLAERFVEALLRESLGFVTLERVEPVTLDGRIFPIGHAALDGRVPVVIAPAGQLDAPSNAFGDGARKRSAFGLAQEYLNAADGALWGIACDGLRLRILRDNASLTRPAWIEADLARIFDEERYADFAALWLIAHETRFGRPDRPVDECALETWRQSGRAEGTRARQHLRAGVEDALLALGNGFLSHPENAALRTALHDGSLSKEAFFQQLLRLVYRMIFLLTVEERGLLHPAGTGDDAKELYADGYGMRRLRERAVRRSAHDRYSDLWETAKIVFGGAAAGELRLGLPALAGLFAAHQCPDLDRAKLQNRALMLAMFRLAWLKETTGLSRVNWRDMGPEELGSVYEGLLELVPQVSADVRSFAFASGGETKGNARKTSGSYYTPDSLVQVLLETALEPVIESTMSANPERPAEALLQLTVVDPACGSGHFLLAAARRIAGHVARLEANGTPSASQYRHALRRVAGRCVYGVDLNPMAVELCKVGLWMEAVEPGLPLTFLDSHIRHGNALLGTTPELMTEGIPDSAWEPIEGDEKKTARGLKKRNKDEAGGQRTLSALWEGASREEATEVSCAMRSLESAGDADPDALARKEAEWAGILDSRAYRHQRLVADAWCAAFVWLKQPGILADAAPTNERWRQLRDGESNVPALTVETVASLARQYDFFHWHLAFPHVFESGGFDVVLGNPPWERVKLQEQEFFAPRDEEIATAQNASVRKTLIAKLPETNPQLWRDWCEASREAGGQSHIVRNSNRYPLCGQGDVNTYALFAEHNRSILRPSGRAGFIVPTGIATDDTTKRYFQEVLGARELVSLYDFQSGGTLFGEIGHARFKFSLVTLEMAPSAKTDANFVFFARRVGDLDDPERQIRLSAADIRVINPNTGTCPIFRSRRDAEITKSVYERIPVLVRRNSTIVTPWSFSASTRWLHMAEDSAIFAKRTQLEHLGYSLNGNVFLDGSSCYVPLYEAKMLHHFDHRYGDYNDQPTDSESTSLPDVPVARLNDPMYAPLPRYWVNHKEIETRLQERWRREWLLGWRDIGRATDERTVIAAIVPRVGLGHTTPLIVVPDDYATALPLLGANLSSFVLDFIARQKVGGSHITVGILEQLPCLPPDTYSSQPAWSPGTMLSAFLLDRILELTYTAWDLEPFARDVGCKGPPFRWDINRRFLMRAELDAAFFHLYGVSHDDTEYILDTFPICRKDDEKAYGEYRTKRIILEIYDQMAEAAQAGVPYRTRLDPPPADLRVAHLDTRADTI